MDQDFKPEPPISSWLVLTPENIGGRIVALLVFSWLIYMVSTFLISPVLVQIGNAGFSAGNDQLGRLSYNLALGFNRDLKEAVYQCNADNSDNQYASAISHCSKAIEINKDYADAYFNRGFAYIRIEQYDRAIPDFSKDIEIIPVATRSYINRGLVYPKSRQHFCVRWKRFKIVAATYDARHPMVCCDEKSVQLLAQITQPLPPRPGHPARQDYEYRRNDTRNCLCWRN